MLFVRNAALASTLLLALFACGGRNLDDENKNDVPTADASVGGACGRPGSACTGTDWCSFGTVGSCGSDNQGGTCRARPNACGETCIGVCGCDGRVYCNACEAQRNGSDVATGDACYPAGAYSAHTYGSGIPRIIVFKSDVTRNVCVRMIFQGAETGGANEYKVSKGPWTLEVADITNQAEDCIITSVGLPRTPTGDVLQATGAQGVIEFAGSIDAPCVLSAKVFLKFDPTGFAWAPDSEPLAPKNVIIGGQTACQQ